MKLWRFVGLSSLLLVFACAGDPPPEARVRPAAARAPKKRVKPPGEVAATEVVRAIRGNETLLRRCFFANPSARGFARVAWRIGPDGRDSGVELEESTLRTRRVERCLLERVGELRFEPREHAARAGWTFVFRVVDP